MSKRGDGRPRVWQEYGRLNEIGNLGEVGGMRMMNGGDEAGDARWALPRPALVRSMILLLRVLLGPSQMSVSLSYGFSERLGPENGAVCEKVR